MSAAPTSRRRTTEPAPERTPRWASTREGADYAGVHTKTIYRWVRLGELPAYRAGKRLLRVDLNDLDALMRKVA